MSAAVAFGLGVLSGIVGMVLLFVGGLGVLSDAEQEADTV